jgi:pyruvate,orthophosphate dikinase
MMETVLNIGLTDVSVRGLAAVSGDERFAWDSYRRLIRQDRARHRRCLVMNAMKRARGVTRDIDLDANDLESGYQMAVK